MLLGAVGEGDAGFYLKAVILVVAGFAIIVGLALRVGAGNQYDRQGRFRKRGNRLHLAGILAMLLGLIAVVSDSTK